MPGEKNTSPVEENGLEGTPLVNYETVLLSGLTKELEKLFHTDKIQSIRRSMGSVRGELDRKYEVLIEEKRGEYLSEGGEPHELEYENPVYKEFYTAFNEYREERNQRYRELERSYKENLERREEIMEEFENLINVEEHMGITFKQSQ